MSGNMHSSMRRMTVCWHICWRTGARGTGRWIQEKYRSGEETAGGTQTETGERKCLPCRRAYGECTCGISQSGRENSGRREPDNIIPMPTTGLTSDENGGCRCLCSAFCVIGIGIDAAGKHRRSHGRQRGQAMSNLMGETAGCGGGTRARSAARWWRRTSWRAQLCDRENAAAGNTTGTAAETVMPEGTENTSNGWNGKQCCRSDGRKYGQCSPDGTSADSNVTKIRQM